MCSSIVFMCFFFVHVHSFHHFTRHNARIVQLYGGLFPPSKEEHIEEERREREKEEALYCKSKCIAYFRWRRWSVLLLLLLLFTVICVLYRHSICLLIQCKFPTSSFHFIPFRCSLKYINFCCFFHQNDTHIMFTWLYSVILNAFKMHTRIIASLCFVWFMPPVRILLMRCVRNCSITHSVRPLSQSVRIITGSFVHNSHVNFLIWWSFFVLYLVFVSCHPMRMQCDYWL